MIVFSRREPVQAYKRDSYTQRSESDSSEFGDGGETLILIDAALLGGPHIAFCAFHQ